MKKFTDFIAESQKTIEWPSDVKKIRPSDSAVKKGHIYGLFDRNTRKYIEGNLTPKSARAARDALLASIPNADIIVTGPHYGARPWENQ
jgi:hypothetical protein